MNFTPAHKEIAFFDLVASELPLVSLRGCRYSQCPLLSSRSATPPAPSVTRPAIRTKFEKMGSQKRIARVSSLGLRFTFREVADESYLHRSSLSLLSRLQKASLSSWPMSQICTNGKSTWTGLKDHHIKYANNLHCILSRALSYDA